MIDTVDLMKLRVLGETWKIDYRCYEITRENNISINIFHDRIK